MIQYTCPKCASTVATEDGKTGQSDTCPNCGNVNVVPQADVSGAQPQTPPPEAAPEPKPAQPGPGPTPHAAPVETTPIGPVTADKDARLWGMLCHLGGLCPPIVPFANVIAPLVIWLIQKDKHEFIEDQGKEAVNFQITVSIAVVVCGLLFIPLAFVPCIGMVLGVLAGMAIIVADVVFVIMAAMKANAGERYRYPCCIRFLD